MAVVAGINNNASTSPRHSAPDVVFLRGFYASPLGGALKRRLREMVAPYFLDSHDNTIVGIGYATPLLRPLLNDAPRSNNEVISIMPTRQGAMYWPVDGDNRCVLSDSGQLPIATNSAHCVMMMHALEYEAYPLDALREAYRVLAPGGKLLVVVPRNYGLWRWLGDTPWRARTTLRHDTLKRALRSTGFTWICDQPLCAAPALQHRLFARLWYWLDRALCLCLPPMGSAVLVEAEKQIYAAISSPIKAPARQSTLTPAHVSGRMGPK